MRNETKTTESAVLPNNRIDERLERNEHEAITFCGKPVTKALGIVVGSYVLDWVI